MKRFLLYGTIVLLLGTGCASQQELERGYSAQERIVQMQTQRDLTPMFQIKCGTGEKACTGMSFSYTPKSTITVPKITNTNDTISNITPSIITGVGYVAGAVAATKIFSDMSDSLTSAGGGNVTHSNVVNNGDNNTIAPSTTISRESNDGNSTGDSTNTTSTTDSNNDNSVEGVGE